MFEKHLWKSETLSKDAGGCRCWFLHKWNIDREWVNVIPFDFFAISKLAFTCSKGTMKTRKQCAKYVQS